MPSCILSRGHVLGQISQLGVDLGGLLLLFRGAQRGVGLDLGALAGQVDLADRYQLTVVGLGEALVLQDRQLLGLVIGLAVVQEEVLDALKMKGLILKDARVVKAMDRDIEGYSLIIPAAFKNDGDFKSNSDVVTEEEFILLREYVNKKMVEICEEMLSGEIKIQPTKNANRTRCEYCDFSAICQFDTSIKDNKYKVIAKKSQSDIWNSIRKEIDNVDDSNKLIKKTDEENV